jgi:hypothetical protein
LEADHLGRRELAGGRGDVVRGEQHAVRHVLEQPAAAAVLHEVDQQRRGGATALDHRGDVDAVGRGPGERHGAR